jgi:hypothetical protein
MVGLWVVEDGEVGCTYRQQKAVGRTEYGGGMGM